MNKFINHMRNFNEIEFMEYMDSTLKKSDWNKLSRRFRIKNHESIIDQLWNEFHDSFGIFGNIDSDELQTIMLMNYGIVIGISDFRTARRFRIVVDNDWSFIYSWENDRLTMWYEGKSIVSDLSERSLIDLIKTTSELIGYEVFEI